MFASNTELVPIKKGRQTNNSRRRMSNSNILLSSPTPTTNMLSPTPSLASTKPFIFFPPSYTIKTEPDNTIVPFNQIRSRSPSPAPFTPPTPVSSSGPVSVACEVCRGGHLKCNGEKPCQQCKLRNRECIYLTPRKRGPKPGTRATRAAKNKNNKLQSSNKLRGPDEVDALAERLRLTQLQLDQAKTEAAEWKKKYFDLLASTSSTTSSASTPDQPQQAPINLSASGESLFALPSLPVPPAMEWPKFDLIGSGTADKDNVSMPTRNDAGVGDSSSTTPSSDVKVEGEIDTKFDSPVGSPGARPVDSQDGAFSWLPVDSQDEDMWRMIASTTSQ